MIDIVRDVKYSLRVFAGNRVFVVLVVTILALGIGANTAVFTVIEAALFKRLPVPRPGELVLLNWESHGFPDGVVNSLIGQLDKHEGGELAATSFSYSVYDSIQRRSLTLSKVLALAAHGSTLNVGYGGLTSRANGQLVSGTFFPALGVNAIIGRTLMPDDDRESAAPAMVISYKYWQARFASDRGVLGKVLIVNQFHFTIVGVLPKAFTGIYVGRGTDIWLPLSAQPRIEPLWSPAVSGRPESLLEVPDTWWLTIMARLHPGINVNQAQAELDSILRQTISSPVKSENNSESTMPHLVVRPRATGISFLPATITRSLWILMAAVGLVLLIACADIANLFLIRAASQQKNIAVRVALGATPYSLIRRALTESLLLAFLGALVGLIVAYYATLFLVSVIASSREGFVLNADVDLRVLGFTGGASGLTGILFGVSNALRGTRDDLVSALKKGPGLHDVYRGKRNFGLRPTNVFMAAQLSLSFVLLIGAVLFVRTFAGLRNSSLGFNSDNLVFFSVDPKHDGYTDKDLPRLYKDLTDRLEALPSVRSVTMSMYTPIAGGADINTITVPGYTGRSTAGAQAYINWIGPTFFRTMGIPLLAGRPIDSTDTEDRPKVAVVNEQFVREFMEGTNPLGRRIAFGRMNPNADIEIVGIVGNAKFTDLRTSPPPTVYRPSLQNTDLLSPITFAIRTLGEPLAIAAAVNLVTRQLVPNLLVYDVKTASEQIRQSLFEERTLAQFITLFAVVAFLLACMGVYGVTASTVTCRTREVAIRIALGASRLAVVVLLAREALRTIAVGLGCGIAVALMTTRLTATLLYGVRPTDIFTFACVSVLLAGVALLATYIPTRRAARLDPLYVLREE